jgi:hypothetical protein
MPGKSRPAKVARIAAKIAIGLIAFVLLFVLTCFILNSFDAPLSEQAKALLAAPPNPYPPADNLYLAMAGLEVDGQRSILEMGQERIEAYNQALDSMLLNPELPTEFMKKWESAKLPLNGNLNVGSQRTTSVWSDVKSRRQDIAALLAANQQLYQRYLSLHRQRGYYETARPSYFAPLVLVPQPLRILFLSDVANRIQTGTSQQQRDALSEMQQDCQMWRTVLKGDGTLISKMVAAASLHGDLILLADWIGDPSVDLSFLDDERGPMVLPFDLKDYRTGNAFIAEFRSQVPFLTSITLANASAGSSAPPSWQDKTWNAFQAQFFKLNATENLSAAHAAQWAALADSDPSEFYRNRDVTRDRLKQDELHLSLSSLYNPIGKILLALAISRNDAYPLRVFDVAAYQRLVYLAFQLKRQHIAAQDVPAFLLAHPEWSTHPVDGKPFRWNAETGELAVNTLGEHLNGQRFSLTLH